MDLSIGHLTTGQLTLSEQENEKRDGTTKIEITVFCNLISEMTLNLLSYTLFEEKVPRFSLHTR